MVEIEATDCTALGIEVDVTDHEAVTAMVAQVVSRRGVGPMFWPRMQAAVVVGPWIPRPAPSIGPPTACHVDEPVRDRCSCNAVVWSDNLDGKASHPDCRAAYDQLAL